MNKKKLSLLLAFVLLFSVTLVACGNNDNKPAEETETTETATTETTTEEAGEEATEENVENFTDAETLVVAAPELNGNYINGFGNSSYDVWVKRLLGNYMGGFGYSTVYYDENAQFHVNPTVVESGEIPSVVNADGSKTYTVKIAEDLVWNDGTPITARNYVFGTLLNAHPLWAKTGANNAQSAEDLLGFEEYSTGQTDELKGIKLVDDYTFELTIKAEKVPYFHETAMLDVTPVPVHVINPNLDVDGSKIAVKEGYEVTDADKEELIKLEEEKVETAQKEYDKSLEEAKGEEGFDEAKYDELLKDYEASLEAEDTDEVYADLLEQYKEVEDQKAVVTGLKDGTTELSPVEILINVATNEYAFNYRFKPEVTCGPYKFVEFKNNMVKVTLNDKFKGDENGKKPTIKNVVVQTVNSKLDVDLAIAGTVDIVNGVVEGAKIDKAKNSDKVETTSYARNGYGVLNILNDMGATQYKGVRQAIAYSLDRNEFIQTIAGGYGSVVNGAFGVAQFEYVDKGEEFNEKAINYTRNVDAANQALDTTPYKFEADGTTPWDPAKAQSEYDSNKEGFKYFRYDENGNVLRVIHQGATNNQVSDLIANQLPDNTKLCGIQYIVNPVDFATLLDNYYHPDKNDPDAPTIFNMGTGFSTPNDPYYQYHSSQIDVGDNTTRTSDPQLDELLVATRRNDPENVEAWENGWLEFQLWFNENLPTIPLYANEYFDVYTNRVKGLDTNPFKDWSSRIVDLTLEGK